MPPIKFLTLALAAGLLGGCTAVETTMLQSSQSVVRLDGHVITVSWIRTQDDAVDLVVYENELWSGVPTPDQPRLGRALARRAAEDVMAWRCWGLGYRPVEASATTGDQRHAFRYACGSQGGNGR